MLRFIVLINLRFIKKSLEGTPTALGRLKIFRTLVVTLASELNWVEMVVVLQTTWLWLVLQEGDCGRVNGWWIIQVVTVVRRKG